MAYSHDPWYKLANFSIYFAQHFKGKVNWIDILT